MYVQYQRNLEMHSEEGLGGSDGQNHIMLSYFDMMRSQLFCYVQLYMLHRSAILSSLEMKHAPFLATKSYSSTF